MTIFKNRADAGKQLATRLLTWRDQKDVLILALPRGGVPVAFEIANVLHAPMTVFLVRKLGVPGQEELAMGAIAEGDICILNRDLINQLDITDQQVKKVVETEKQELNRRLLNYRSGKVFTSLNNKIIILVDDGIATGATCDAAIHALKIMKPKKIILATPVASQQSLKKLTSCVDETICLITPEFFYAVGHWYQHFSQTTDEEVFNLLQSISVKFNLLK